MKNGSLHIHFKLRIIKILRIKTLLSDLQADLIKELTSMRKFRSTKNNKEFWEIGSLNAEQAMNFGYLFINFYL